MAQAANIAISRTNASDPNTEKAWGIRLKISYAAAPLRRTSL